MNGVQTMVRSEETRAALLAHCERLTMSLSQINRSLPIHSCILDRALIIPTPIYKILDGRCRKRARDRRLLSHLVQSQMRMQLNCGFWESIDEVKLVWMGTTEKRQFEQSFFLQ